MFYYSKCYLRYSQPLMSIKFETIEQIILPRLKKELNPLLIYHNIEHTLDVLDKALLIAKKEGIKPDFLWQIVEPFIAPPPAISLPMTCRGSFIQQLLEPPAVVCPSGLVEQQAGARSRQ